jgi:hypothetical protein
MANAVTPVSGNNCKGTNKDGSPNTQMKCVKFYDVDGNPVFTCAAKKFFYVNCPPGNRLCSSISGGWVAAATVCAQKLY